METFKLFSIQGSDRYEILRLIRESALANQSYLSGHTVKFSVEGNNIDEIRKLLKNSSLGVFELFETEPDVEDCFINLMLK